MQFQLAYIHLTLPNSKGQGQSHANLYCEYFESGGKEGKHYYCHQKGSQVWAFN